MTYLPAPTTGAKVKALRGTKPEGLVTCAVWMESQPRQPLEKQRMSDIQPEPAYGKWLATEFTRQDGMCVWQPFTGGRYWYLAHRVGDSRYYVMSTAFETAEDAMAAISDAPCT